MIPDIQLQLKAAIKSLRDNVLPAVDPHNELAQQQMQLAMATIEIAMNNLPAIHRVLRTDIEQHVLMAQDMEEVLAGTETGLKLASLVHEAEISLQDPSLGFVQLQLAARMLRSGIGDVIAANAEGEAAEALEQIVLAHSDDSLALGRALNKPMGFESSPDDVSDISSLVDS
ncbi:hypothetical protein EHM94_17910 [Marinobacter sp. NP-6]|uniref:hypothetical protein n=1 Tax=Marinobacter sp. NP-6 TaxID=2488666 RepID=UPI000FCB5782|nr:hypothetical protein [Marinobacter sp. NP-6]RUT76909.1 hypothetical protein EHM94_17910 [Marinobacter sp. NP-6]